MPKVIYIASTGARDEVDVAVGVSVMHAAMANGVAGILGDCGGNLSCATCHVFVASPYLELLPAMESSELEMLDYTAAGRRPNSRLCCQLVMTEALDGLTVHIADPQI